jgi:hypothetical protein
MAGSSKHGEMLVPQVFFAGEIFGYEFTKEINFFLRL